MYFSDPEIGSAVDEMVAHFSKFRDYLVDNLIATPPDGHRDYIRAVCPIIDFVCERQQALTMLIQYGYLWDAEIVLRSIMEGALRVSFLSFCSKEEREMRISEYYEHLPDIERLKQSDRARETFERVSGDRTFDFFKEMILPQEEESQIREKWPKKARRVLEQKWSFSEIIRELEKNSHAAMKNAVSSVHNYGMSSHIIHADYTAVMLKHDRNSRGKIEKEKLIKAHWSRLVSDEIAYIGLCCMAVEHVLSLDARVLQSLFEDVTPLLSNLAKNGRDFRDFWLSRAC